ncbi:efflux RND transporter periplasmic adaptor subunit [Idiomarina abyssalis]|uniref:efflux RND transporter periplasmic adaptor subunit n=1 Tax=Idiomarina abyssalis TaxID=86102 RepID=UPI001CD6E91E|nr:efflux RND transporter periplasmic adaptor subunit [Idiomarina abyssalis]
MTFNSVITLFCIAIFSLPVLAYEEKHAEHEVSHTNLSDAAIENAKLTLATASAQNLRVKQTIFGVIAPNNNNIVHIGAKYKGIVTSLKANIGDAIKAGQTLAVVENVTTGTAFEVISPISGEVTARFTNVGEVVEQKPLFEVLDPSSVWVELSAFPENIESLAEDQTAHVYDLHHHKTVEGTISYLSPQMTGGHIARARIELPNQSGHWRPGMHVKADVVTDSFNASLAINNDAVQRLDDNPVVFVKEGNRFEAREVELGRTDGEYTEVLSGIENGESYVVENSYLIKADILKQGAGHSH